MVGWLVKKQRQVDAVRVIADVDGIAINVEVHLVVGFFAIAGASRVMPVEREFAHEIATRQDDGVGEGLAPVAVKASAIDHFADAIVERLC